jgi:LysM repeat protein
MWPRLAARHDRLLVLIGLSLAVPAVSALRPDSRPDRAAHTAPATDAPAPRGFRRYVVQPGDTLSALARRFGVAGGHRQLAALNGLADPDWLHAEVPLRIPERAPYTDDLAPLAPTAWLDEPLAACPARDHAPLRRRDYPDDARGHPDDSMTAAALCARAWCAALDPGVELCKCAAPRLPDDDTFLFSVRAGRVHKLWQAPTPFSLERSFEVRRADLDGDGDDELIVADLEAVSNGMMVTTWRISVLEDLDAPRLSFAVHEYGDATLVRADRGCDLLATSWRWAEDPLRGVGTYLVGRRLRYRDGALEPVAEFGVLARRLTYYFHLDERPGPPRDGRNRVHPGGLEVAPLTRWLAPAAPGAPPHTEVWPRDRPLGERVASRRGVIEGAHRLPADPDRMRGPSLALDVRLADTRVRFATALDPDLETPALRGYDALGRADLGVLLPEDYTPADPRALVGRRVRIDTYDDGGFTQRVVWLADAR